jgi:hypothetical protein
MADHIGTGTVARLLGVSTRTVKRQAGTPGTDLAGAVVTRLDGDGAYVFDHARILEIVEERIDAARQRIEAAS